MSRYAYDIYPPGGPGLTRLVRLTASSQLRVGTAWRVELNGTGAITIVISRYNADCTAANFNDGNYVQVVDTVLNKAVAGGWMPAGTVKLLSESGADSENLTIQGAGVLGALSRYTWLNEAYVAPGGGAGVGDATNSPRTDGQWHWPNNALGAILYRLFEEALDSDRPDAPLAGFAYDFDGVNDSASDAWTTYTGDWTQSIGANGIGTLSDVIKAGVTVLGHPDLLVQAYQNAYGTDRSGSTYGLGVVRFQSGVNIAADLDRTLQPNARVKTLLVKGTSTDPADMIQVTDSGAPDAEGFLDYGVTADATLLAAAGAQNIALRQAQTDLAKFPILLGTDVFTGKYVPSWPGDGGHFWLGDTVTLHTGTGELDFNEEAINVAAITAELLDNGDDKVSVELGATFYDFSKSTQVTGGAVPTRGGCTCPQPALDCLVSGGDPGTSPTELYRWSFDADKYDDSGTGGITGSGVNNLPGDWRAAGDHGQPSAYLGQTASHGVSESWPVTPGTDVYFGFDVVYPFGNTGRYVGIDFRDDGPSASGSSLNEGSRVGSLQTMSDEGTVGPIVVTVPAGATYARWICNPTFGVDKYLDNMYFGNAGTDPTPGSSVAPYCEIHQSTYFGEQPVVGTSSRYFRADGTTGTPPLGGVTSVPDDEAYPTPAPTSRRKVTGPASSGRPRLPRSARPPTATCRRRSTTCGPLRRVAAVAEPTANSGASPRGSFQPAPARSRWPPRRASRWTPARATRRSWACASRRACCTSSTGRAPTTPPPPTGS